MTASQVSVDTLHGHVASRSSTSVYGSLLCMRGRSKQPLVDNGSAGAAWDRLGRPLLGDSGRMVRRRVLVHLLTRGHAPMTAKKAPQRLQVRGLHVARAVLCTVRSGVRKTRATRAEGFRRGAKAEVEPSERPLLWVPAMSSPQKGGLASE